MIASLIFTLVVLGHFLFSGGWMQPGAMSPLLIGLAGLGRASHGCSPTGAPRSVGLSTARSFSVFGIWSIACAVFAILTLAPELKRGPVEQLHLENRLAELPIKEYSKILESSGWDPDPPSWLLRGAFQRLTDRNLGQATRLTWLDIYKKIKGRWIANDPRNWLVYSQVAIMDAAVLDGCRTAGMDPTGFLEINDIVAESARATKLNPSSAQVQLQQAVILYWARDLDGANAALAKAAEIDQLTPHADRKLSVSTIWVPSELMIDAGPDVQRTQVAGMPGFFQGEPVFSWLRKVIP